MNKGLFHGWQDVFSFTFKQGVSGKGFKGITIGLALLLLIGGMAISVIMAFVQQKDATEVSMIETVYVVDESGLDHLDLNELATSFPERYPVISFQMVTGSVQEIAEAYFKASLSEREDASEAEGYRDVILHIEKADAGYELTLYIPELSEISEGEGESFLEYVKSAVEYGKVMSSGISSEQLVVAVGGVETTLLNAGEEEQSVGELLVSMLLPMILMFFMYMMILMYGQNIGNIVSVEKTSKLMEMILTMTRPYGLIFGKIASMTTIAILQMLLWIGCFAGGFIAGDAVAKNMVYADYNNVVLEVFELLSSQNGSTAFSVGAVVLSVLTICLAFLFYCVFAGLVASFATKTEDLAQVMSYYQLTMIAGFFGAYMLPLQEKEWINTILRIVPFTGAYLLPGDIVVGNITVWEGLLYVAILFAATIAMVIAAGKIYKNQLFYRGSSLLERIKRKK